jgi:P27 family predicted phage terminase small subunit
VTGNPGKRPLNEHEAVVAPGFPPPPKALAPAVRRAYFKLGRQLKAVGLCSRLDGHLLCVFAQVWVRWLEAEAQYRVSGPVIRSPNNFPILNPFLAVSNTCQKQLRLIASEYGLSPASRNRVAAVPRQEPVDPFEQFLQGRGASDGDEDDRDDRDRLN